MPKIVRKSRFRFNKKKIFQFGVLALWLDTDGNFKEPVTEARLELKRLRTGTKSTWGPLWAGAVRIDQNSAQVETKS